MLADTLAQPQAPKPSRYPRSWSRGRVSRPAPSATWRPSRSGGSRPTRRA